MMAKKFYKETDQDVVDRLVKNNKVEYRIAE